MGTDKFENESHWYLRGKFRPDPSWPFTPGGIGPGRTRVGQSIFVPAAQSPLKNHRPYVSDADRLELIKLAIRKPRFYLFGGGIKADHSYTVDTLRYFSPAR